MKKTLALAFFLSFFVTWAYSQVLPADEDNFEIRIDPGDKTVIITGYRGKVSALAIPRSIQGKAVTGIDDFAFSQAGLTEVSFPDTLRSIGTGAFANNELKILDIPDSVTEMGAVVFQGNRIASLALSKNCPHIGQMVFASNKLTEVIVPDGVRRIDDSFLDNEITRVFLPDSVREIWPHAFEENNVSWIRIGGGVELETNSFDEAFYYFYIENEKRRGVYIKKGKTWEMELM